jgi:hypothetical protein
MVYYRLKEEIPRGLQQVLAAALENFKEAEDSRSDFD